jgi:hypothetical protein
MAAFWMMRRIKFPEGRLTASQADNVGSISMTRSKNLLISKRRRRPGTLAKSSDVGAFTYPWSTSAISNARGI